MYYTQPSQWYYYPDQSNLQDMRMPEQMPMMSGDMNQMMGMMREHIRTTEEIRRMVHEINERCKRMEAKMMR